MVGICFRLKRIKVVERSEPQVNRAVGNQACSNTTVSGFCPPDNTPQRDLGWPEWGGGRMICRLSYLTGTDRSRRGRPFRAERRGPFWLLRASWGVGVSAVNGRSCFRT